MDRERENGEGLCTVANYGPHVSLLSTCIHFHSEKERAEQPHLPVGFSPIRVS